MGGHEGSTCAKGDEEEGRDEGHEGDEEEGSHEGHEGDEEESSHEGHEGDEEEGSHEGHEGDEEEGSHEGHEGHEEVKAMRAIKDMKPLRPSKLYRPWLLTRHEAERFWKHFVNCQDVRYALSIWICTSFLASQ